MRELMGLIDREGSISHQDLHILVKIIDVKQAYGRTLVNVTPIAGNGTKWVQLDSVRVSPPATWR